MTKPNTPLQKAIDEAIENSKDEVSWLKDVFWEKKPDPVEGYNGTITGPSIKFWLSNHS